jgi:hypothetical protein
MMTAAGVRIMTELLTAELKAGRIRIEGDRIYRGRQQVEPRLSFVRTDDPPATSTPLRDPAPGLRLQASGRNAEEVDVSYPEFAPLPKSELLPTEQAARAREATSRRDPELLRQREAVLDRLGWPRNTAPLPEPVLIKWERKP